MVLLLRAGLYEHQEAPSKVHVFECDREATVDIFVEKIKKELPTLTDPNRQKFTMKSKAFIDGCIKNENINQILEEFLPTICEKCSSELIPWKRKTESSFLLDCGELKIIKVPINMCPKCKHLEYPNVLQFGLINIHNKVIISYRMLIEISNVISSSLVEFISLKLQEGGFSEGLSEEFMDTNIVNLSSMIERSSIAVISLLIREDDMNNVVCYICGACPPIANSDGNSKDTIAIDPSYMVYVEDGEEGKYRTQFPL